MPKSVPFRAMVATIVDPATSRHGSALALPAAMARLRKNWSFAATNAATRSSAPRSDAARARCGIRARAVSEDAATFRWCISSPMRTAWAMRARRSIPPPARMAAPRSGPASAASHRSRSITLASLAPKRSTLPRPSFTVAQARLPTARFSTTKTGMDGVTMPVIGPAAPAWWQGRSATAPVSTRRRASSSSAAHPS